MSRWQFYDLIGFELPENVNLDINIKNISNPIAEL
jgi:hypothetical protein